MRRSIIALPFFALVLNLAAQDIDLVQPEPKAKAPTPALSDEQLLEAAGIKADGAALLDYLKQQTLVASDKERIGKMIKQLGDEDFGTREKAQNDLIALGRVATKALEAALKDPDLEVQQRAERCLEKIRSGSSASLPSAVARLVAAKKPAGAAEVLLGFLPTTENDVIAEEIRSALAAVALVEGKGAPALVKALGDKDPIVRAAAGEALTRADAKEQNVAIAKLLTDENPNVRLRVAMARAKALDKEAVPVLIDALGQLSPDQLWQAEELLLHLGGPDSPNVSLGTDEAGRKKCRDGWAEWWKANQVKIDLAKLGKPADMLGYTIVVLLDKGLVMEVDRNNKVRWQFEGAQFPLDVQHLPGDRVLLAEMQGDRVTERNHKGEIQWEKKVAGPLMAQRLPNGNTFIANRLQVLEVDAKGNEVFTHILPDGDSIMRASKLRNGDIGIVTMSQQFLRLDAKGKQLSTFNVNVQTSGGRIDVLPNGHVLVPEMRDNKIVEYDRDGKAVWEVALDQPIVAVRLRNGNTLATSMTENRAVEFDRTGKQVWEYKSDTRVNRAYRR